MIFQTEISLPALSRGMHIIDSYILDAIRTYGGSGICHIFIKHTSAALALNEGADSDVRHDMHRIMDRLAPEGQPFYRHTQEGDDDMPAHAKALLTGTSLTIPISGGKLLLGTWQSVWLCEYRNQGGSRDIVITIIGV